MKKYLYPLLCLLVIIMCQPVIFGQIVITTSGLDNFYGAGTSDYEYSNSSLNITMNIGAPSNSQAQVWTAPEFDVEDSSRVDYIQPASTPFASHFPGATYASKTTSLQNGFTLDLYKYIKLSNDTLYFIGMAEHYYGSASGHTIDTALIKDTSYVGTVLPAQMGAAYYNNPDTISLGQGYTEIQTTSNVYDAYGTLVLPIGSFQAIRLKQTETNSVYNGSVMTNSYSSYNYTWLTSEGHQLKVDVDTQSTSGNVTINSIEVIYSGVSPTAVKIFQNLPLSFKLDQNYPNPFNPSTNIRFQIPKGSFVTLKIYDVLGREVRTLINEQKSPGAYTINFNGSNLSSGIYFYKLQAGSLTETKKLILLK